MLRRFALTALLWLYSTRAAPLLLSPPILQRRDPLPDFALQYAPYIFLSENERWWPSDVLTFLNNTRPEVAGGSASMSSPETPPSAAAASLTNLATLPSDTYLTSIDNIDDDPAWLYSEAGRPDEKGYSAAPAIIIVAQKDDGVTDVFYFVLFNYNQGKSLVDLSFGNHVGDWEYAMIRFLVGSPETIFLSQHAKGSAYPYSSLIQTDGRVTIYSAEGSHGFYPLPGKHFYDAVLYDETDQGYALDILQNYESYLFDSTNGTFSVPGNTSGGVASASNSDAAAIHHDPPPDTSYSVEGGDWLTFEGYWGDKEYSRRDPRQTCIFGHCKYEDGPHGPYLKNLGRIKVCQDESDCNIKSSIFD